MKKKIVVIFCRYFDKNESPFKSDYYRNAYIDLLLAIKAQGAEAYFATNNDTYKGNGVFEVAYTADSKVPLDQFRAVSNIKADVVYDKGRFAGNDVTVLNPEFVRKITADKIETYKHFGEYQPLTIGCANKDELLQALERVDGDLVVVKAPSGNGGDFVYIDTKERVIEKIPDAYPMLAQEFIDTSVGVDGLADGMHDLRVKIGGGEIWGGTLRIPAPGEYRANVAKGGSERLLFPEELPEAIKEITLKIDSYFKGYPRYFAADFANTPNGWKLIELNSKPGLSPVDTSPQCKHITDMLAKYLISLCK